MKSITGIKHLPTIQLPGVNWAEVGTLGPEGQSGPMPVFIKKMLLESNHFHSPVDCLQLQTSVVETEAKGLTKLNFLLSGPLPTPEIKYPTVRLGSECLP